MIVLNEIDRKEIISILIKKNGKVRVSKPKVDESKPNTGRCAYVWRMVMFQISTNRKHHCMPVCADFDLCPEDWKERKELMKELDVIVNEVVDNAPKSEWHGIHRWGKALGYSI